MSLSSGILKTKVIEVSTLSRTFEIPIGVAYLLVENIGTEKILIQFENDCSRDWFTLKEQTKLPVLNVLSGSKVRYKTNCFTSNLQLLMWG